MRSFVPQALATSSASSHSPATVSATLEPVVVLAFAPPNFRPGAWAERTAGAAFLTPILEALDVDGMDGAPNILESVLGRGDVAGVLTGERPFDAMGGGARDDADVADKLEWTSVEASCLPREDMAQPARAPAAPVAELTKPAGPAPFAAAVVVIGP